MAATRWLWSVTTALTACGLAACVGGDRRLVEAEADAGTTPIDAVGVTVDAAGLDASDPPPVDAAPIDAAPIDAPIDATPVDAPIDGPPVCLSDPIDTWIGTADRIHEHDIDDMRVDVTWTRVATADCVDRYTPSGTARFRYHPAGLLCDLTLNEPTRTIAPGDGSLTIDRTTSPPTYSGHASTRWTSPYTMDCGPEDTYDSSMPAGGVWFHASGSVGARIAGWVDVPPDPICESFGPGDFGCDFTWALDPL